MPNINLIAQKRQEKARLERLIRRLFLLTSTLVVATGLLFFMLSAQWFRIRGEITSLDSQIQKLQPRIDKVEEFDKQTAALQPKINLYGESREHTLRWYSYLQVVARSLPENTWLTRISPATGQQVQQPGTPPPNAVVNVQGITLSQKLVGETMLSLNRYSALLDKVELHYTQEGKIGETPTVEFEVATNIKDLPAIFVDTATQKANAPAEGEANANQTKS
ncbi:MAG: PilN domain-containing protein [Armatimonadetes bacterium]|nr:PilN domain-containing protein [Armatimonadota bacterium]